MHDLPDALKKYPKHLVDRLSHDDIDKIRRNEILHHSILDLLKLQTDLGNDVNFCITQGIEIKWQNQFWHRALFRAFFAFVEGMLYQFKQIALKTEGTRFDCGLTMAEIALLKGENYDLKENGKINVRTNEFPSFKSNFRFTFNILSKAFGLTQGIDFNQDDSWGRLLDAYQTRNRLVHPKSVTDLNVDDKEMENIALAYKWYSEQTKTLAEAITEVIQKATLEIRAEGKAKLDLIQSHAQTFFLQMQDVQFLQSLLNSEKIQHLSKDEIEQVNSKLDNLKRVLAENFKNMPRP